MRRIKHLLPAIILILTIPALSKAQQNFDALRKKYLAFVNEQYNLDSALVYTFKMRDAALRESGARSATYFRALNSIGYVYNEKDQYDSAAMIWLQCYQGLKDLEGRDFLVPVSSVSLNLMNYYGLRSVNADSAVFFAHKYIAASKQLSADSGRAYLNLLCEVAVNTEHRFGAGKAAPFYALVYENWKKQLGVASLAVIKGIDSLLSANPGTNTTGRRQALYTVADTAYSRQKLEQLFTASDDEYASVGYAAELLHAASSTKGEESPEFIEALHKLALAYYHSINDTMIAAYLVKKAIAIAERKPPVPALQKKLMAALHEIEQGSSTLSVTKYTGNAATAIDQDTSAANAGTAPKLILPISHPQGIIDALFSPDEKYVVTRSYNDQTVKLWQVETGELIYNLGMEKGVGRVRFTSDNQYIITVNSTRIETRNRETGKRIATISAGKIPFDISFIPDSANTIVTVDSTSNIQVWNVLTGKLISSAACNMHIFDYQFSKNAGTAIFYANDKQNRVFMFEYHFASGNTRLILGNQAIKADCFSDNRFVSFIGNKAFVFDRRTYALGSIFNIEKDSITSSALTPAGDKLLVCYNNRDLTIYNTIDGSIISSRSYERQIENAAFIDNGKTFILRFNLWANIMRTDKQQSLYYVEGDTLSRLNRNVEPFIKMTKNQDQLMMVFSDNELRIWDVNDSTARLRQTFHSETRGLSPPVYISGNRQVPVATNDGVFKMVDPFTGKTAFSFTDSVLYFGLESKFSNDGRLALLYGAESSNFAIFHIASQKIIQRLQQDSLVIRQANFSRDDKYIVTAATRNDKGWITIWDWENRKMIKRFPVVTANNISFDSTGKKLLISHIDSTLSIYNLLTNKTEARIPVHDWPMSSDYVSNGKYIISLAANSIKLIDPRTYKVIRSFPNDHSTSVPNAVLTKDARRIVMGTRNGMVTIRDVASGDTLQTVQAHSSSCNVFLSADEQLLITVSEDATIKVWDFASLRFLYQVVPLSGKDYIVADAYNHYDGTENARKLLYFTCGTEVVGLDQVKDQLWVPRLAERILNGEKIDAPALVDLNICGLTPVIKILSGNADSSYRFMIIPGTGGLSETVLYVNGIEVKRYQLAELARMEKGYELKVPAATVSSLFVPAKDNKVSVKAYTAEKGISGRGVHVTRKEPVSSNAAAPDVYAVMVGVSDYKGDQLDLRYAAKDANDLSRAVAASARKLLNKNGNEHVFVYNLTAEKDKAINAGKKSIRDAFTDIAAKAKPTDILLIFFAGHGVMEGEKKQFYFLTADASEAAIGSAGIADVGISTTELSEWMHPNRIKAQKRILIFDACNSGQAITELVAVRDDKAGQQVKAIEKLNEKSGLFILSASASNQSAYEMGQYSQGLLTYTLLKAMKDQPDVLEDNQYLNISKWFNAAEKNVNEIVKETGNRQQPQVVSTTNFNIGIVDEEVMATIHLPTAKPLFTASNFQNSDEAIADDNLELGKLVNTHLSEFAARGLNSAISYNASTNSPDAYSLSGRYDIAGNTITVKVNIKYHKAIQQRFEVAGKKDQLAELAAAIADKAAALISGKAAGVSK